MKKVISVLSSLVLALSVLPMTAFAAGNEAPVAEKSFNQFDFNEDGYIDALDVAFLFRYYLITTIDKVTDNITLGITEHISQRVRQFGDINHDGRVNTADGSLFLRYVLTNTNCKIEDFEPECYSAIVSESVETGDVNGDGIIDAVDASNILSYYALVSTEKNITTSQQLVCRYKGDMNGDGIVDSVDASVALKVYAENSSK